MDDFIYMWNLKKQMNKQKTENRVTDTENKHLVARGEVGRRREIGEGD